MFPYLNFSSTVEITGEIANGHKSREAEKEIGDNVQVAIGAEEKENDEAEGNSKCIMSAVISVDFIRYQLNLKLFLMEIATGPTVAELTPKSSRIKGTEDVTDALTIGDTVKDVV